MKSLTRKIALALVMAAVGFVAAAQTKIAVEAPNIVGSDEQFNVTFIIEGEDRPSNFNWNPGDDFTLVWGPQRGESTSIRVINGKRSKSSQFTYTYILAPKKTGKFELPAATAKMKGETIIRTVGRLFGEHAADQAVRNDFIQRFVPEIYGKPHLGSCRPAAYGRIETVSERGYRGIRRCEIPGIQRLLESGNSCSEQYQLPEGRSGRKAV